MVRVNGKIRAREVRVIDENGQQLGILGLPEAIRMAQSRGVDLVEIAATANPPVCRLIDYGKFRYEQSKKDKESRKHQHANKVKEIQLSPGIDPHDYSVKLNHAVEFLCEEMKVKIALRFRGREMMHTEYGFQVVEKFINDLAAYAHPDSPPKLIGKGINVMVSPLPRNKRGKNPVPTDGAHAPPETSYKPNVNYAPMQSDAPRPAVPNQRPPQPSFNNNPFSKLDSLVSSGQKSEASADS
jgi:translation initiation factor IF-3